MRDPAGDALHYRDGSHRWVPADPATDPHVWRAMVKAHIEEAARAGGCDALARRSCRPQPPAAPGCRVRAA